MNLHTTRTKWFVSAPFFQLSPVRCSRSAVQLFLLTPSALRNIADPWFWEITHHSQKKAFRKLSRRSMATGFEENAGKAIIVRWRKRAGGDRPGAPQCQGVHGWYCLQSWEWVVDDSKETRPMACQLKWSMPLSTRSWTQEAGQVDVQTAGQEDKKVSQDLWGVRADNHSGSFTILENVLTVDESAEDKERAGQLHWKILQRRTSSAFWLWYEHSEKFVGIASGYVEKM